MESLAKMFVANPIMFFFTLATILGFVIAVVAIIAKILKNKNIKFKDVEINNVKEEMDGKLNNVDNKLNNVDNKLNNVEEKMTEMDNKLKRTLTCISTIANDSINSGYERCIKRQHLYDKQTSFSRSEFDRISRSISNEYRKNNPYSNIEIILDHIFYKAVYKNLYSIYKQNNLNKRSKENLIEEKRAIIDSTVDRIIGEIGKTFMDESRDQLIDIVKSKSEEIKRAMIRSLEMSYDFAKEEIESLIDISKDLDKKIRNSLYFIDNADTDQLHLDITDELPPNDIIGDY